MKFEQVKYKFITFFIVFTFIAIFVPTAKAEAAAFRQTNASSGSVTVSWDNTYNSYVQGYHIYVGSSNVPITVSNTVNSYTISGLQQGCAYTVLVLCSLNNKEYYFDSTSHDYIFVRTKPKKLSSNSYKVSWNDQNKIKVKYTDQSFYTVNQNTWYKFTDGIEVKVKDLNGKKKTIIQKNTKGNIYVYGSEYSFAFKVPSAVKNKGLQYQIRTFIQLDNGKKIYGDWTTTKVLIPQAKITKLKELGSDKVQVTWKKVSGAESYTIWKTTNNGASYKKVITVNADTKSYTVSDFEAGDENGIVITARVKVGKKKYNSQKSYYTYYN